MGDTIEQRIARRGRGPGARVGDRPAVERCRTSLLRRGRRSGCGARSWSSTRSLAGAPSACGSSCNETEYVRALGALTGGQAVEMVKAGLQAIYLTGWQVAADANLAGQTYPDQSLYPANSVPAVVRRINNALQRADQIAWSEGGDIRSIVPIVADAEAGFGGALNAFELMRAMIEAGRRRRALRGPAREREEVRAPRRQGARADRAVRAHADRGAPGGRRARRAVARRRAHRRARGHAAHERHRRARPRFTTGERTHEGFYRVRNGLEAAIARGLAYAPYADMLWCETSTPDLDEARAFAEGDPLDVPRQAARVQLQPLVQLEAAPRRRRRSRGSRRSSARWATSSSSSRSRGSTR